MRYTWLSVTFCVLTLVLGSASICRSETPPDSLWIEAVALWDLNDDLVPGLMKMQMQEVDKHGEIKDEDKYHEVWSALSLGEDGRVEYEVVKAIENGKDITEEEKAKQGKARAQREEEEKSRSHEMEGYSPFDPESQKRISVSWLGAGGVVAGRSTALYEFTEQTEDDVEISGKVWLANGAGAPVRIEYTPDPLPKRVKSMVTTMDFEQPTPDSLIVKRMFVEVTGGILFFKKHFHMNMTFEDYWRLPEGYGAKPAGE